MKISAGTIARTAALIITVANAALTTAGKNPLPFSDTDVYIWITKAAAYGAIIAAWWKNNSFTSAAIKADKVLQMERGAGV